MEKKIKKIGIICDLFPNSGLGHLRRMKYLAAELNKKRGKCHYIFNKKYEKFIKKFTKDIPTIFFEDKGSDKYKRLVKTISKIGISTIIFDSYVLDLRWEREFIKEGFFVAAIDDHLKKHHANLIITNRSKNQVPKKNYTKQNWIMGQKYVLVKKNKKIIRKTKKNTSHKKILLHAGGSSLYNLIENFTISTFKACNKFKAKIFVLCTTEKSKKIVKKIAKKIKFTSQINYVPFTKNLTSTLSQYDIIAGPTGTTTFETILADSLTFSSQLKNDGRDSLESWHSLGNLMHLDYYEKNNLNILHESWKLIFEKYHDLKKILKKNSLNIDGKGPQRVAEKILEYDKKINTKNKIHTNKINNKNKFYSKPCTLEDARGFLNSRNNIFARSGSTKPSHIISWPEHVRWWINKDIAKFAIKFKEKILAYHWIKLNSDPDGKFLTSGWFLSGNKKKNIKIAFNVLKFQIYTAKKKYKNLIWIIIMKKENRFVRALNSKLGFNQPNKKTIKRALKAFNIKEDDYTIMEMHL